MRRSHLARIRDRICTIALKGDRVIPPASVAQTVNAASAPHPTLDHELHFPFPYSHEMPFPIGTSYQPQVDKAFAETFAVVTDFLR
jgi:hypothetical protein